MKDGFNNLRAGAISRSMILIAGAVVSALGLTGVVAFPALEVDQAQGMVETARERSMRYSEQSAVWAELSREGELEAVRDVSKRLERYLSPCPNDIELHSATRLVAKAVHVELGSLSLGRVVDLKKPVFDRSVAMIEVAIHGSGKISSIAGMVRGLRQLGYPCNVLEVNFSRSRPAERTFDFHLSVGVFFSKAKARKESDALEAHGKESP